MKKSLSRIGILVFLFISFLNVYSQNKVDSISIFQLQFQNKEFQEAEKNILHYLENHPGQIDASVLLAYLYAWKGDVRKAKEISMDLSLRIPNDDQVKNLNDYLKKTYSDQIHIGYWFLSDDQPVQSHQTDLEYNKLFSAVFSPGLRVRYNQFNINSPSTILIAASNQFTFGYGNTKINTEGGLFSFKNNSAAFVGKLSLIHKMGSTNTFNVSTERIPYQYTLKSISAPFLYNLHKASLLFDKKKFMASLGTELQQFSDQNLISTTYAWALLPLVKQKSIVLMMGYSFSYAHSRYSRYENKVPLATLLQSQSINSTVEGFYPYFTPLQQQVHSLLMNLRLIMKKNTNLEARGSYGIYGIAKSPFIILEKTGNRFYLQPYQTDKTYTPITFDLIFKTQLSDRIQFEVSYQYSRLFFYNRSLFNTQLNFKI